MPRERKRTGNPTHQSPYPLTLIGHVTRAIEHHQALLEHERELAQWFNPNEEEEGNGEHPPGQ